QIELEASDDKIDLEASDHKIEQYINQLNLSKNFVLTIARLVNYKRVDLAIKACAETKIPLVVVGAGPEKRRLINLANKIGSETTFLENQPQAVVNHLLKKATVTLNPGIDDFGLVPIQANYFGTPAVLNKYSGVAELVKHKTHGIHHEKMTVESVSEALNTAFATEFDSNLLKSDAKQYNKAQFLKKIKNVVKKLL
ncbi:MAG: glycosyltransferase, partial [Patescibacteria group bacterium]|nr:glycosyltransferase [Patescibacteria group bacterium]